MYLICEILYTFLVDFLNLLNDLYVTLPANERFIFIKILFHSISKLESEFIVEVCDHYIYNKKRTRVYANVIAKVNKFNGSGNNIKEKWK